MAAEPVEISVRYDGYTNAVTGLGLVNDKKVYTAFSPTRVLTDQEAMNYFHGDDLARLICSLVPNLALRRGCELVLDANDERETTVTARMDELKALQKFTEACIFGRASGCGLLFVGVRDGQKLSEPLNKKSVYKISALQVFDKREVYIQQYDTDLNSPTFGEPILYRIQSRGLTTLVHASRCIVLGGALTARFEKEQNGGFDHSVLNTVYQVLQEFGMGWGGAVTMLADAAQGVFKTKGLNEVLSGVDGLELLTNRMKAMNLSKGICRTIAIDSEEEYLQVSIDFSGVPLMLDRLCNRLAATSRIPVSVLMGQAPAGLGATGQADLQVFNDSVEAYRRDDITPALRKLYELVLGENGGEIPHFELKWKPVDPMFDKSQAELRKLMADTDAINITQGVYTAEDVARQGYSPEGFSIERVADWGARPDLDEPEVGSGDPNYSSTPDSLVGGK